MGTPRKRQKIKLWLRIEHSVTNFNTRDGVSVSIRFKITSPNFISM